MNVLIKMEAHLWRCFDAQHRVCLCVSYIGVICNELLN